MIGRDGHHDGFAQTFFAQTFFNEIAYFASTLADEGDDVDGGARIAGKGAQQHAFAYAATGENSDALSLGAGATVV